jgi:hypothetical protein
MSANASTVQASDYLVPPETAIDSPGAGAPFELGPRTGKLLLIVLRVTEIIEQESLLLSIWGSTDGKDWGAKGLFQFPERFYCSATPASLDLARRPEIRFLQARWHVNRWGRGYPRPFFKIAVEIQDVTGS